MNSTQDIRLGQSAPSYATKRRCANQPVEMNLHRAEISKHVTPDAHAVLTIDGAGWHRLGGRLQIPPNVTLLHLPPYSPELNRVENVWT